MMPGSYNPWLAGLEALAARFGHGLAADLALLNSAELWGLYLFLRALLERSG